MDDIHSEVDPLQPETTLQLAVGLTEDERPLTTFISAEKSRLGACIQMDGLHNLLTELDMQRVFNKEQLHLIAFAQLPNPGEKLLEEVAMLSYDKIQKFLSVLDKIGQSFVANYVRNRGVQPHTDEDFWPLFNSRQIKAFLSHATQLTELIDPTIGLVDELVSLQVISFEHAAAIDRIGTNAAKIKSLINILLKKSVADYKRFVDCLIKTKQIYAASILDKSRVASCRPLTDEQMLRFQNNYSSLLDLLELQYSTLLTDLVSVDCITSRQEEFVTTAHTQLESKRRLLKFIRNGSQKDFYKFLECLGKTGQTHVAQLLKSEGSVMPVVAETSLNTKEETEIVENFFKLYQSTSACRRQELLAKLHALERTDSAIIAMQTGHSIKLFILCRSLPALRHLRELYVSEKLKTIIEGIFAALLNNSETVTVSVHRLVWDLSDFLNGEQHLSKAYGLPLYSQLLQMAPPQSAVYGDAAGANVFSIDKLPQEIIEMILIRAAAQLFNIFVIQTSSANKYTLVTLGAVSRDWRVALTYRRSTIQLLKRFFTHVCHPYRFNPKWISTNGGAVCAEFNDKLCVAGASPVGTVINLFKQTNSGSFDPLVTIKVPGSFQPHDMAVCSETRRIYLSEVAALRILRVDLSSNNSTYHFTLPCRPYTLSVQSGRLLVTAHLEPAVYLYSKDFQLIRSIQLPDHMLAYHALESLRGTFIVGHSARFVGEYNQDLGGVSELSADGHIIHTYPIHFDGLNHIYLTLDVYGHILALINGRVIHFNSELKLQQVLLTQLTGSWRIRLSQNTTRLIVGFFNESRSDTYKVSRPLQNITDTE